MNKLLLLIFIIPFYLNACGQEDYIIFGKGGGITGEVNAYKLFRNGKILKGKGIAEINFNEESKIRKKEARRIFQKIDSLTHEPFNQPGNMYYFIEKSIDNSLQKYTWGSADYQVDEGLKELYRDTFKRLLSLEFQ
jgi:hypothetical protein